MAARYFLLDPPAKNRLMRLGPEDGLAYRWKDGQWGESPWVYGRVTGLSGDSDFEAITEEQEKAYLASA